MTYVYVGSRTTRERNARGEGIGVYRLDAAQGRLEPVQVLGGLVNPSYLALNRRGDRLYTVHGDGSAASVLAVDAASGRLRLLQTRDCQARNPVHLALDPGGRHLALSSHLTGELLLLPVADDGLLGPVAQRVALPGTPGPHRREQPFSKPHFNPFDPSGRWVVVPDKGLDRVFSFRCEGGRLSPAAQPHVDAREGAGPRNLVFHPSAPYAYVVNELDSTVTAYRFDAATGALAPLQILPTLPDDFCGNSRAAGIAIDAAGRTLYASNRGHDSIAAFRIDAPTGRLRWLGAWPSGGRTPRFFTLAPDGRHLFALNEDSDGIAAFAVDAAEGTLAPTGWSIACGSPVCMVFSPGLGA
ncbi:lactonase family protein [Pseudorhodoferax sp.]|uniref:lactonase family protein n=1 Tax=Pseudorhodoferax sp. TaxID=1993553 RepID=UPI0039E3E50D